MLCDMHRSGDVLTCRRCGRRIVTRSANVVIPCGPYRRPGRRRWLPRPRVGDWIEAAARLLWITPERIERFTRRPCGCASRKRWLNQRVSAAVDRLEAWLLDPLGRGR